MKFLTPKQMANEYGCYSTQGYRYLIRNADKNGFKCCMRRVGRKILINTEEFEKWIEGHK